MSKYLILALLLTVGCGYSSKDNELVGQVKRVTNATPLLCFDHSEGDISLGILRNGVGSMSKEDVDIYIASDSDAKALLKAQQDNKVVKITYNQRRMAWCTPDHWVTKVEILQ